MIKWAEVSIVGLMDVLMVKWVAGTIVRLIDIPTVSARGMSIARPVSEPDFRIRLSVNFADDTDLTIKAPRTNLRESAASGDSIFRAERQAVADGGVRNGFRRAFQPRRQFGLASPASGLRSPRPPVARSRIGWCRFGEPIQPVRGRHSDAAHRFDERLRGSPSPPRRLAGVSGHGGRCLQGFSWRLLSSF